MPASSHQSDVRRSINAIRAKLRCSSLLLDIAVHVLFVIFFRNFVLCYRVASGTSNAINNNNNTIISTTCVYLLIIYLNAKQQLTCISQNRIVAIQKCDSILVFHDLRFLLFTIEKLKNEIRKNSRRLEKKVQITDNEQSLTISKETREREEMGLNGTRMNK